MVCSITQFSSPYPNNSQEPQLYLDRLLLHVEVMSVFLQALRVIQYVISGMRTQSLKYIQSDPSGWLKLPVDFVPTVPAADGALL